VPEGKPPQGRSVQTAVLSRVLRELGGSARARATPTAVAVSTSSLVMRLLELPQQIPANVAAFVDNELAQCVMLSGRTRRSDFCGISPGSGPQKRLLAVGADAGQIGGIVEACAAAGITARAVEPSALAYLRAFLAGEKGRRQDGNTLLAVLGDTHLVVYLFCGGALNFLRIRALPAGLEGVAPFCAWLTEELEAVLRYCRAGTPGEGAAWRTRLVLHNAAYSKDDIVSRLAVETGGTPLEIVPCEESPAGGPAQGKNARVPLPSAVAVGAAMRLLDIEGDDLRIDLMPPEVVQARLSSRRMLLMANAAALALVALLLTAEFLTQTTGAMDRQIEQARLADRLPMMPALVQQDRYLDSQIAEVQGQLARLQTVRTRREMDWPTVLNAIWQARPAGVSVTYFLCDDNRAVLLKGVAASHGLAKAFVRSLDGQGPLASAWMKHIQRLENDDRTFEFEIHCVVRMTD